MTIVVTDERSGLLLHICASYFLWFYFSVARPRPASSTTPATPAASTNGDTNATQRRRIITKPPVPKQVPSKIEKKPAAPRTNRSPYPSNAPTPDLKNVRSKIGSTDNIKYQPGGGKVGETQTIIS